MRISTLLLIICASAAAYAQAPVTVVEASWRSDRQPAAKAAPNSVNPQKELTSNDKYWQRKARENQVTGTARDPNEGTLDSRRAALDKINDEARTPKTEDVSGFTYAASFKNETQKTIAVIFWEYRFTELAAPQNISRREFICVANIKPGSKGTVSVFSTRGPSDVVSADSLSAGSEKLFDGKVIINRIEFTDDSVMNRGGWKYEEHKAAIDKATSTKWSRETCRSL